MLNKEMLSLKEESRREEILNGEILILHRNLVKDSEYNTKKINAQMSVINDQIEFEEKLKNFLKKRRLIQGQSILRKNKKEKFYIYQGILKKEEEKRKQQKKIEKSNE